MPYGDGTGPMGMGPRTGRGAGYCAGFNRPGFMSPGFGRRFFGRQLRGGGGRGWRNWYYATGLPFWARRDPRYWSEEEMMPPMEMSKEQEMDFLKSEAEMLQKELENLQNRIVKLTQSEK